MEGESFQIRWIDGEEEEQNLDTDNPIFSNIKPTLGMGMHALQKRLVTTKTILEGIFLA